MVIEKKVIGFIKKNNFPSPSNLHFETGCNLLTLNRDNNNTYVGYTFKGSHGNKFIVIKELLSGFISVKPVNTNSSFTVSLTLFLKKSTRLGKGYVLGKNLVKNQLVRLHDDDFRTVFKVQEITEMFIYLINKEGLQKTGFVTSNFQIEWT